MRGNARIYAILRDARHRATAAGVKIVEEQPINDAPVDALVDVAAQAKTDLLVVGNVGLNARSAILGRLFPGNVSRRVKLTC